MKLFFIFLILNTNAQQSTSSIKKLLANKTYQISSMYRNGEKVDIPKCKKSYFFTLKEDGTGIHHNAKSCESKVIQKSNWKVIKKSERFFITNGIDTERIEKVHSNGFTISYPDSNGRIKLDFIPIKK